MKQDMKRLLRALWIRACRYDKIPPDAMFVVFSDDNPYVARYNKMMSLYNAACVARCKDIPDNCQPAS